MTNDSEKTRVSIDLDQACDVQERLNKAEYALQLLADRMHPRLEKLLYGLKSHYRVVNGPEVLNRVHAGCNNADEELLANSKPAGSIVSSFKNGNLDIQVYSCDLNQAELISRSHSELVSFILQAIGLTGASRAELPVDAILDALLDRKE